MSKFEKRNTTPFTDALLKEAQGLKELADALAFSNNTLLRIPTLFDVDEHTLMIDSIAQGDPTPASMEQLGQGLAQLHKVRFAHYGYESDNYLGMSRQPNVLTENWGQFFADQRLTYQISQIRDRSTREDYASTLRAVRPQLVEFLNANCSQPSLVHGDFWAGNVLFDGEDVWLIDPAIYYGDREVDIAMSEMFGGFLPEFYRAYDRVFPRSRSYAIKRDIYNLYHYLNHYNLFGPTYLDGCEVGMAALESL